MGSPGGGRLGSCFVTRTIVGLFALAGSLATPALAASPSNPPLPHTLAALPASTPQWAMLALAALALITLWLMRVIRPGGLDSSKRDVRAHPWWLWLAASFVVLACQIIAASLVTSIPALAGQHDSIRSRAVTNYAGLLGALVGGIVVARLASATAPNAGLRIRAGDIPRAAIAFFLLIPIVLSTGILISFIHQALYHAPPDQVAHELLRQYQDDPRDPWIWALLAAAIVLAPIVEELIYRAFLQTALLRLTNKRWPAVFLASLIFALIHLLGENGPTVPWHAIPTLFVLALGLGAAYERTARLGVPILMHMLFNAANVAMLFASMRSS